MPPIFGNLSGSRGRVDIPYLGVPPIGEMSSWTLKRRADRGPDSGFYDLHAVFASVNEAMFNDPDYTKVVIVRAGRLDYELEQEPGQLTELQGRILRMERVRLCRAR